MEENQLKINDAKAEFIVLGTSYNFRKNTLDNIKIGETKIHQTSKIKFLGVYLDEQLNLKDHIQNRTKKANHILMLICNSHKILILTPPNVTLYLGTKSTRLCQFHTIRVTNNYNETISNNTKLCSQHSLQEVKKRGCLHMSTRITMATYLVYNKSQTTSNSL